MAVSVLVGLMTKVGYSQHVWKLSALDIEKQENILCRYGGIWTHLLYLYYGFMLDIRVSVHLSVVHPSVFLFPDDNLSKHQWIFTKLGMCIDIMVIWFAIANGQISSNFYGVICPRRDNGGVLKFNVFIFSNKLFFFFHNFITKLLQAEAKQ